MRVRLGLAGAAGVALAVGVALTACTGPAMAQRADWIRALGPGFGGQVGPPPSSHQFVRQWEMHPGKGLPTLSSKNIAATEAAIARYRKIVANGGWDRLPSVKLEQGATHAAVEDLRRRLVMTGHLKDGGNPGYFDHSLAAAVRRYQEANGLAPTGIVDKSTVAAMNVPATARLRQLRINLDRLRRLGEAPDRFILVNIPAAQIEAVENGVVVSRHAGVVGKRDRQTPILRSSIQELNFNPVWNLPPTVVREDLIPTGRRMARQGESALVKFKIEAYANGRKLNPRKINWSTAERLTFRQQPGPENPLGFVKLNFPNGHAVYMHDTPGKSLFGRSFRAASSGCVRVSNIEALVAWVAAEEGWTLKDVRRMKKTGERRDLRLKRPVPLYLAYITAWATPDGKVHFRRDLYLRDGVGKLAGTY